jgi:3-hydroxy acid dehydrogenase/malonic semialdehyde reductase
MMSTTIKTVLVTGATSGYGQATARRFHGLGHRVIVTGRRQARLDAFVEELGERALALCFDVSDKSQVDAAIEGLAGVWAEIDVLVNNAGLALGVEPAWDASVDDWETMVDTNIKGLLYCTHRVLPGMIERGGGHVINISSVAASWPYPGGNVYGASKAFVTQFSLNLRADLVGKPVRVTSIEPGLSKTEFSLIRYKGDPDAADKPYAGVEALTAADIAESVVWAAELPSHVNINRIELMPTMQAFGAFAVHRES